MEERLPEGEYLESAPSVSSDSSIGGLECVTITSISS